MLLLVFLLVLKDVSTGLTDLQPRLVDSKHNRPDWHVLLFVGPRPQLLGRLGFRIDRMLGGAFVKEPHVQILGGLLVSQKVDVLS
jgi:hypothetical protein